MDMMHPRNRMIMKTYVLCKKCNNEILIKGYYSSRWDLTKKYGKTVTLKCKKCNSIHAYNIDEISARQGFISLIALIMLPISIGVVIWLVYPYVFNGVITVFILPLSIAIPILIYFSITKNEKTKLETFNSERPNGLKTIKFIKRF